MNTPKTDEFAHIGKSVVIKGELSGSEDLYLDGSVEGTIELHNNSLIIGPNGKVHASVHAKGVVVQGKMEGNIRASERAELRKTAVMAGDIVTRRIAIEEGAYLKGKVDIEKESDQASVPLTRPVVSVPVASAVGATSGGGSAGATAPISGMGGVPGAIKNSSN